MSRMSAREKKAKNGHVGSLLPNMASLIKQQGNTFKKDILQTIFGATEKEIIQPFEVFH